MEYIIKINPENQKEFLQIMRSLQSLQVVEKIEERSTAREELLVAEVPAKSEYRSSSEVASQYRDLVD